MATINEISRPYRDLILLEIKGSQNLKQLFEALDEFVELEEIHLSRLELKTLKARILQKLPKATIKPLTPQIDAEIS